MKVALAGASGSGKTTLGKEIAELLCLNFIENSAGLVISDKNKTNLAKNYDYVGNIGQVGVINLSHQQPNFGYDFQYYLLEARKQIMVEGDNLVVDRSALDPVVFFLNQVVHNFPQEHCKTFIDQAADVFIESGITHLIRTPLQNPEMVIEDNGSRVANWYFQLKIDGLFDKAISLVNKRGWERNNLQRDNPKFLLFKPITPYFTRSWDKDIRLKGVLEFLRSGTY